MKAVLINGARIFDGENEKLAEAMSVLIEGNKIAKIAKSVSASADATVIDAKGRVLMPGLIDAHWHTMLSVKPISTMLSTDLSYLGIAAANESRPAVAWLHLGTRCRRQCLRRQAGD